MAAASPTTSKSSEFFPSIALMRAVAALMVVYSHLVPTWLERAKVAWPPSW